MFDLMGRRSGERYGTGMWPLYYPRPWNINPPPGVGAIIDPVAVASEVAKELRSVGWPGLSLMDDDFQMTLLDAPREEIAGRVEQWFTAHRTQVAEELQSRLGTYNCISMFKTAKQAMVEAILAYRDEKFLITIRIIMPEFESVGRTLLSDPAQKTSQATLIKDLQEALRSTPIIKDDPLESMSLFHFIEERLFASCHTEADAAKFGRVPNRHAELHGLDSYGNLQGASVVVCAFDLMMKMLQRQIDLGMLTIPS